MDQRTNQIFFALLRSAICETKLTQDERELFATEQCSEMFQISSNHNVAHLLALGLKTNGLISKEQSEGEQWIFKAVYWYEQINHEYENICEKLENAQIRFLPLKGAVLREYYPEPWMRTSCDIDIYVPEEESEKALTVLTNELGYIYEKKGSHDFSLYSPTRVHIELHYTLVEEGVSNETARLLETVWDTATVRNGFSYWYEMPDEMFYFYHVAHMAKHFVQGGCGIRPFLDLFILDRIPTANFSQRKELLKQGKLLKFAEATRRLSEVWFGDAEMNKVSLRMHEYILQGGVYGNNENRIIVQQQKKGGRVGYALSKIFIPYRIIKFHYPILEKYPVLTPVMEVRRWFKLIFCGHLERTMKEMQYNSQISSEEAEKTKKFLKNLGL